jgi:glucokinase
VSAAPPHIVLADLGGSNARFALSDSAGEGFSAELCLACADFPGPQQALEHYLQRQGGLKPAAICIAAAGPVVGAPGEQRVRMTNHPWQVDARELSRFYGGIPVRLLNDFAAVAWSVPLLTDADTRVIGPAGGLPDRSADFTVGLIGPGTGLGVSGLMCRDGAYYPIAGEGGHVGLAPENPLQVEVWRALHRLLGADQRIYQERLLSGPGVEDLYLAIGLLHDTKVDRLEAAAIFQRATAATDPVATDTIALFFEVLGQAAGNQALTIGAFQGVYIAGGIVPRYPELLHASQFRAGFENKGTYRALMEAIPTLLIEHPQPGLLGAAFFARKMRLADTPT